MRSILVNSSTSAPAMKPLSLPERITSPLGGCAESSSSTIPSSASTSCESVLVDAPSLSRTSHASSSASRSTFQCCRTGTAAVLRSLDQHRSAQPAADADRCNAPLALGPLEHIEQMQDDACPGSADGMTERDSANVDVELRRVEHPDRCVQAE